MEYENSNKPIVQALTNQLYVDLIDFQSRFDIKEQRNVENALILYEEFTNSGLV